jgi:hypothetical protein
MEETRGKYISELNNFINESKSKLEHILSELNWKYETLLIPTKVNSDILNSKVIVY